MPICLDTIVHEQHWVQIHIQMTWTFGTPKNNVISKATSQISNNYTNRTISSFSDWKDEFLFGRELTMIFTAGFSRYFFYLSCQKYVVHTNMQLLTVKKKCTAFST